MVPESGWAAKRFRHLMEISSSRDWDTVRKHLASIFGLKKVPEDALVLSLRRGSNTLITHGDRRLRLHDWLTVLGSDGCLEEVAVRFEGEAGSAKRPAPS